MKKILLTSLTLGLMAVSAHANNLLIDGDFSDIVDLGAPPPNTLGVDQFQYQGASGTSTDIGGAGGWTFTTSVSPLNNDSGIYLINTFLPGGYAESWIPQASINNTNGYVVQLDSTNTDNQDWTTGNKISQTVDLSKGTYSLTFSINTEANNGLDKSGTSAGDLLLDFSAPGSDIFFHDGGTPIVGPPTNNNAPGSYQYTVKTVQPADGSSLTWQTYTVDFWTSGPGPVTITLADDPISNNSNISVEDVDLEAIPEPSTWAMLLGGLGLLAWRLRARRSRV